MSSSDWKEVKLGEVADLTVGFVGTMADEYVDKGIPFLRSLNIEPYSIKHTSLKFISESFHKKIAKSMLTAGDVVIVRTGKPGTCAVIPKSLANSNCSDLVIVHPNHSLVNSHFLAAYINTLATGHVQANLVGAVQQHFNVSSAKKMSISLPSLSEQNCIANTLGALNDKIELNNRIIKNLEEVAQAIFKSWFIDFEPFQDGEFENSELGRIPKGWRVGALGDIADIIMGQSPSGSSYNTNRDGEVFYQGRTDFGHRYPAIRLYTTEPKRMADKGDILLSVRAPVGDINLANSKCCIGRGLAALKSKNECQSFLLYQLLNINEKFKVYDGEGTVFGSINKDALRNLLILIPPENHTKAYQKTVSNLDELIEVKSNQNQTLSAIRDALLPKLMSGEIRVPVEEAQ